MANPYIGWVIDYHPQNRTPWDHHRITKASTRTPRRKLLKQGDPAISCGVYQVQAAEFWWWRTGTSRSAKEGNEVDLASLQKQKNRKSRERPRNQKNRTFNTASSKSNDSWYRGWKGSKPWTHRQKYDILLHKGKLYRCEISFDYWMQLLARCCLYIPENLERDVSALQDKKIITRILTTRCTFLKGRRSFIWAGKSLYVGRNANCMGCKRNIIGFRRKNCHHCGSSVCSRCSEHKLVFPRPFCTKVIESGEPARVCNICEHILVSRKEEQ